MTLGLITGDVNIQQACLSMTILFRKSSSEVHAAGVSTNSQYNDHVLVTGGAGFIGSHAALALLEVIHKYFSSPVTYLKYSLKNTFF